MELKESRVNAGCGGRGAAGKGLPRPGQIQHRKPWPRVQGQDVRPSLAPPQPLNGAREPVGGSPGVGRGDGASQSWARGSSVAPRGAPSPGRRESPHAHLPVAAQGPCLSSPQTWGQSTAGPTLPAAAMIIGAGGGVGGAAAPSPSGDESCCLRRRFWKKPAVRIQRSR